MANPNVSEQSRQIDTSFNLNRGPFHQRFFARNSNSMETSSCHNSVAAVRSQQIFAHATTAQLSCHVQNFVAITVLESSWEWNVISIKFELLVNR